jgi:hypothetical protein
MTFQLSRIRADHSLASRKPSRQLGHFPVARSDFDRHTGKCIFTPMDENCFSSVEIDAESRVKDFSISPCPFAKRQWKIKNRCVDINFFIFKFWIELGWTEI